MTATRKPARTAPDARMAMSLEELVRWAVRDQKADRTYTSLHRVESCAGAAMHARQYPDSEGFDYPAGYPMDSVARAMEIGDIGTRIDGGGPIRGVAVPVHDDAEMVVEAIRAIRNRRQRGLVLEYAQLGDRPDWSNGTQMLVRVQVSENKRGPLRHRVEGVWERQMQHTDLLRFLQTKGIRIVDPYGRRRFPMTQDGFQYRILSDGTRDALIRHCPLEFYPSDAWIKNVNALYSAWHAGMMALLGAVRGLPLRDYHCTGFNAPATPWVRP